MRLQPIFDIAAICAAKGIKDAVVCPGSRCAPLTLAFARHPGITTRTISDERSAAFIALGIAQQTKRTVVLICTSGTAAYNFAPAVAEAYYQRVPLLVLTADRPVEWIGQWDGQTISQQHIYGKHVLKFYQLPQEYDHPDSKWSIGRIVNEAINSTQSDVKGPVHVNVPLREPLYSDTVSFSENVPIVDQIKGNRMSETMTDHLSTLLKQYKKILVVGGQYPWNEELISTLNAFTEAGSVPVIGDIISNLHPLRLVVRYADSFLPALDEPTKNELRPDLLITFGQSVISKNLKLFLRACKPSAHWHIDEYANEIPDPFQSLTLQVQQAPMEFFAGQTKKLDRKPSRDPYTERWIELDSKASTATSVFFTSDTDGELKFVDHVLRSLPAESHLHLANSMSVRYANFCGLVNTKHSVRVYSNRGTSGIDGCTSTAVGHALSDHSIHTLITGDVAFFYDRNAFWNKYPIPNLRVILLNNHGGAIFGMIDGPGSTPEGEEYFITQQSLTAEHLANEFNLDYRLISDTSNIASILDEFFKMDSRAKILEFESNSREAKSLFLRFKEKIKKTYAA